jgi:rubrerythrin
MNDKIKKMEEMAEMEENYAISYDKNVTGLGNVAISELIRSVAHDSFKHAGLYRTIATILKGPILITDQEFNQLEISLRKHIDIETKMITETKALMEKEQDDRVQRLLEEIYIDEIRHHKFLSNLLEAVIKKEMILESDIWDMIWKDVPTHGAPRDPYV